MESPPRSITTGQLLITAALCAFPVAWLLWLLQRYYVPCFHSDEWTDTLPIMAHYLEGKLKFTDLYQLVGDHRLFFPHLISLGLAIMTGWDVRYELVVELILAGLVIANVGLMIRQFGGDWRLMPVVCVLILSPAGYENWLLGYQICFWLALACLTAIPWVACTQWKYPGTALLCFVASFSSASGLVSWAMALILLCPATKLNFKAELSRLVCWLGMAGLSIGLYFQGWSRRTPHFGQTHPLQHPVESLLFFLSYLGNPYARGFSIDETTMGCFTGTFLFMLFVAGAFMAWQRRLLQQCLPWLVLGLGMVLIAAETGYGRLGAVVQQSRYVPFGAVFSIAVIFLFCRLKLTLVFPFILTALAIFSAINCNGDWQTQQHLFDLSRVTQQMVDVFDETNSLQSVTIVSLPNPAETIAQMRTLEKHGWRTTRLEFEKVPAKGYAQSDRQAYGLGLQGKAMISARPADAVIFTKDGIPFDMTTPTTEGDWYMFLPPGQFDKVPEAWAYDADTQKAYPLPDRSDSSKETIRPTK